MKLLIQLDVRLTNGCSVRLTGKLVKSLGSGQEKELIVDECEVMGSCDPEARLLKQLVSTIFDGIVGLLDISYTEAIAFC